MVTKILWLEDQLESLSFFQQDLEELGFEVISTTEPEEAIELTEVHKFDIIISDIRMPGKSMNGLQFIDKVFSTNLHAKFAVVSSFLYLKRYISHLNSLPVPVLQVEKMLLKTRREETLEKFKNLAKMTTDEVIQAYTITPDNIDFDKLDPFTFPLSTYLELPPSLKAKIDAIAFEKSKEAREKVFWVEDADWIVFCGSLDTELSGPSSKEMSDKEIEEMAFSQNVIAFYYSRPFASDDISDQSDWTFCQKNHCDWYPNIDLKLGNIHGKFCDQMTLNFDTGTYVSFFSLETALDKEVVEEDFFPAFPKRSTKNNEKKNFMYKEREVTAKIGGNGNSKIVAVPCVFIKNWEEESPWAKKCPHKKCKNKKRLDSDKLCPERYGLIGRNFLIKNKIGLTLDGAGKTSEFVFSSKKKKGH